MDERDYFMAGIKPTKVEKTPNGTLITYEDPEVGRRVHEKMIDSCGKTLDGLARWRSRSVDCPMGID